MARLNLYVWFSKVFDEFSLNLAGMYILVGKQSFNALATPWQGRPPWILKQQKLLWQNLDIHVGLTYTLNLRANEYCVTEKCCAFIFAHVILQHAEMVIQSLDTLNMQIIR